MRQWIRVWLVPGAVFQSVTIGGGYGTGREIVEFVSKIGPLGGVAACMLIALLFGILMGLSFDIARVFKTTDYRRFMKNLLGPGWVLYEFITLTFLVVILAICGAAAGQVVNDGLGLPLNVGVGLMLIFIVALTYLGREWVERTLTLWSVLITGLIIFYAVTVFVKNGSVVAAVLAESAIEPGWWKNAARFAIYNTIAIPTIIYVTHAIDSRAQAWGAGMIGGVLGATPALLLHLSFMSAYPGILDEELPTYHVIGQLGMPLLMGIYLFLLFGAIAQTGAGILHGFNERLDTWWRERRQRGLNPNIHASIALGAVLASLLLANLGIVTLIAKGYGALMWISLFLFVGPLSTVGVWKLYVHRARN